MQDMAVIWGLSPASMHKSNGTESTVIILFMWMWMLMLMLDLILMWKRKQMFWSQPNGQ